MDQSHVSAVLLYATHPVGCGLWTKTMLITGTIGSPECYNRTVLVDHSNQLLTVAV